MQKSSKRTVPRELSEGDVQRGVFLFTASFFGVLFGFHILTMTWDAISGPTEVYLTKSERVRVAAILEGLKATSPARPEVPESDDFDSQALLAYLEPIAQEGSPPERTAALRWLLALDIPGAEDALFRSALTTGCPLFRQVLEELSRRNRDGVGLRLVQAAGPGRPLSDRIHAAYALGILHQREGRPLLLRILEDEEESSFLRRACLTALRAMPEGGFEKTLLALRGTSDPVLKRQIDLALRKGYSDQAEVEAALGLNWVPAPDRVVRRARSQFDGLIREASERFDLDPDLIRAVIEVESDFRPAARSRVGALGLMQLMPDTAKSLGVRNRLDPRENILGGARYLRRLIDRFSRLSLALAAYNAGPGTVEKYRAIPPYRETRRYVRKVLRAYRAWSAGKTHPKKLALASDSGSSPKEREST